MNKLFIDKERFQLVENVAEIIFELALEIEVPLKNIKGIELV
jgi:hypothetical protein